MPDRNIFPYIQGRPTQEPYPIPEGITEEQFFQDLLEAKNAAAERNPMSMLRRMLIEADQSLGVKYDDDTQQKVSDPWEIAKALGYGTAGAAAGMGREVFKQKSISPWAWPMIAGGAYAGAGANKPSDLLATLLGSELPGMAGRMAPQGGNRAKQILGSAGAGGAGTAAGYQAGTSLEKFFNPDADPTYQSSDEAKGLLASFGGGILGGGMQPVARFVRDKRGRFASLKKTLDEDIPARREANQTALADLGVDEARLKGQLYTDQTALAAAKRQVEAQNKMLVADINKNSATKKINLREKIDEVRGRSEYVDPKSVNYIKTEEEKLLGQIRSQKLKEIKSLRRERDLETVKTREQKDLLASYEASGKDTAAELAQLNSTRQQLSQNPLSKALLQKNTLDIEKEAVKSTALFEEEFGKSANAAQSLASAALSGYMTQYMINHSLAPDKMGSWGPWLMAGVVTAAVGMGSRSPKTINAIKMHLPADLFTQTQVIGNLVRAEVQRSEVTDAVGLGNVTSRSEQDKRVNKDDFIIDSALIPR